MDLTTNFSLKKPTAFDNADLRIFVGDNMDLIDIALNDRITSADADLAYAPLNHAHGWTEITDKPITFTPNLMSTTVVGGARVGNGLGMSGEYLYIKASNGLTIDPNYALSIDVGYFDTNYAIAGHEHSWDEITAKPTISWNVNAGGITDDIPNGSTLTIVGTGATTVSYDSATQTVTINSESGTGGTTAHTHEISEINGLQDALDTKYTSGNSVYMDNSSFIRSYDADGTARAILGINTGNNILVGDYASDGILYLRSKPNPRYADGTSTYDIYSEKNIGDATAGNAIKIPYYSTRDSRGGFDEVGRFLSGVTTAISSTYIGYTNGTGSFWRLRAGSADNLGEYPASDYVRKTTDLIAPTFLNGWTQYGASYRYPCYLKTDDDLVVLTGLLANGSANTVMFTLPTGYRPTNDLMFTTFSYNGACRVDVRSNGEVYANTNTHSLFTSIAGIVFKAEQ